MAFCLDRAVETELRAIAGNNVCVDCDGRGPQWASVSFGIFMCLECSGRHRSLGVHISFVRSVAMDSWTEKQINIMRCGGNAKFIDFLNQYSIAKSTPIARKYSLPAATLYKDRLLAEVEGRPLPTELPKDTNSGPDSASATQGGTDPLPGETEEQYVARQKKLQAEAKERLRAKFGSNAGTGLNARGSGGAMQGIGSDASYRPGSSSSAVDTTAEVTAQVVDGAQKALSLLSSSWTLLGESVSKSVAAATTAPADSGNNNNSYANNTNSFSNGNNSSNNNMNSDNTAYGNRSSSSSSSGSSTDTAAPLISPETIDVYKQNIAVGWSALATGAVGLWSKSLEVVQTITAPPDDEVDFKFPRGTYAAQDSNTSNNHPSQQPQSFSGNRGSSTAATSGDGVSQNSNQSKFFSQGDANDDVDSSARGVSGMSINNNYRDNNSNNNNNMSSLPTTSANNKSNSQSDTNSLNNSNRSSNQNISATASASAAPTATSATLKKSTTAAPTPKAPVGDDFFATFGV